jgi:hypothetical protein
VLPTMAASMEQVCVHARVLLWRWLGKRCCMSYNYSARPPFRELFDGSSYTKTNATYKIWRKSSYKIIPQHQN